MVEKLSLKSDFSRNVLTLASGTALAQVIPIAITPILTRLYSPDEFGILALFIAITAILGAIANGRYELAILLPEKDEDAVNVAAVGVIISFFISIFLIVPILFYSYEIAVLAGSPILENWLFLVPLFVFITGLFNVFNYLNTRAKMYGELAKSNIYKSLVMSIVQLALGWIKLGVSGLIIGQFFSLVVSIINLMRSSHKKYDIRSLSFSKLKMMAVRYKDFPKFSMWAILANSLSYNMINVLVSVFFGIVTLGTYSLAQKSLAAPTALIGRSIGQVYFQQASDEKQKTGNAIFAFRKAAKRLVLLVFVLFLPLFFILPDVFEVIFGEEWRISGDYARVMLPAIAAQFVASALSNTNNVFERQRLDFLCQLILLIITIGSMMFAHFFKMGFYFYLMLYSALLTFYYVFMVAVYYKVSKGGGKGR